MKKFLSRLQAALVLWVAMATVLSAAPGDVDTTFNPNANTGSFVRAVAVQPDGKTLVGGNFTTIGGTARPFLARLNPNGSLDTAFNPNPDGMVAAIIVLADGQIIVGGEFLNIGGAPRARLARLSATGALDTTYDPGSNNTVICLALQPDGLLLVAGAFTNLAGATRNRVGRLNPDGSLDASFDPNVTGNVQTLALQPDGMILIGGGVSSVGGTARTSLARVNANGSLDSLNVNIVGFLESVLVQPDGGIVIGGNNFTTVAGVARDRIARLSPNGTLDLTFNPGAALGGVLTLGLQTDAKLIFGGSFIASAGNTRNRIARLNADVSLDSVFNPNADGSIYGVALDGAGRALLVGDFSQLGSTFRNRVARVDADPATKTITIPTAGTLQWLRGGSSPETFHVTFERSADGGITWAPLGTGTRVSGGWTLAGLNLQGSFHIRARARTISGQGNGSSGLVEQIEAFTVPVPEIEVAGGSTPTVILTGDTSPTTGDGTDFGSVVAAGTASQASAFTIRNVGAGPLGVTSVTSSNAGEFAVSGFTPGSILAAGSTPFTVTFDPSGPGTRTATITVASDDADEAAYTFLVQGNGLGSPEVELRRGTTTTVIALGDLSPDAGDGTYFGNFPLSGTQTSPQTFTVHNLGDASLTLTAINQGGSNPADFLLNALSSPLPATIPAGGTFTFNVTFDPTVPGSRSSWITLVNSDSDEGNYLFAVGGFATTPPAMTVRGLSVNINNGDFNPTSAGNNTHFQDVATCGTPKTHTFTIWNFGTDTLQLTGSPVVVKGGAHPGDFTVGQPASTSILGGGWLDFTVTFNPAEVGLRTATLSIATNDPLANPYTFAIAGNGIGPEIEVIGAAANVILGPDTTPSTVDGTDLGNVLVTGNATASQTFTIHNRGNQPLTISSIMWTNQTVFALSGFTSGTIAPSASQTFTVTFDPAAVGPHLSNVTINSNDCNETTTAFVVQGTGLAFPEITVRGGTTPQVIASGDLLPETADGTQFDVQALTAGLSAPRTFKIHNDGDATLTVTSVTSGNPEFPVSNFTPGSIAPGAFATFDVSFDPSVAGLRTSTITIANDDADESSYTFLVQGNGGVADMSISGKSVIIPDGDTTPTGDDDTDFFDRIVCLPGSVSHTFTIRNTGSVPLTITAFGKSGAHPGDFTINAPTLPLVLAGPSGIQTFTVDFDPTAAGTRTAVIEVTHDAPGGPVYNFTVTGNGTGSEISVIGANNNVIVGPDITPSTADGTDLGSVAVAGNTTLSQVFTITNSGSAPLTISSITWTAQDVFTITGFTSGTIAVGTSQTFTITFDPIAAGPRISDLTINSNDCDEATTAFVVKGTGLGAPEIVVRGGTTPQVIANGDILPETADGTQFDVQALTAGLSAPRTFKIHNDGDATLTVTSVTSGNPAEFPVSNFTPGPIAPGAFATFDVSFDPAVLGLRTSLITIANNDADEATTTFLVQGNGGEADMSISGKSVIITDGDTTPTGDDDTDFFGRSVCASGSTSHTFTIRNTGSVPLTITAFGKSGPHAGDFTVNAPTLPLVLAGPSGIQTFTVDFDPSASGPRTAVIEVTHDGPGGPVYNFTVTGEGTGPEISIIGANNNVITTPDGSPSTPDGTDLGTVTVAGNATLSQTFTITNSGSTPLVISSLTWSDQTVFTITGFTSGTIAPGASQTFTVTFDPIVAGPRMSDITINSNDCDEAAATFVVRGTGAGAPTMVVRGAGIGIADGDTTPTGFDLTHFDNVALCYGTPVTHTFTIHNTGTAPLILNGTPFVDVGGVNATDFSATQPALTTIPVGGQTSFTVTFTPFALGTSHATVSIASDDSTVSPYEFAIAGFGVAPEIDLVGGPLGTASIPAGSTTPLTGDGTDFGTVTLGSSLAHAFTITNTGTYTLFLNGTPAKVAVSGANQLDFQVTQPTPNFVNANAATPFTITFAPLGTGVRTALITIANTDCDENSYTFIVRGNGTGAPEIEVSGLGNPIVDNVNLSPVVTNDTDFGTVPWTGSAFAQHTFTITNTGASPLHLTGTPDLVTKGGAHPGDFAVTQPVITSNPPSIAPNGGTATFTVTFDPSAAGLRTATLTLANDDTDEPLYTFAIWGNGSDPALPKARIEVFGNATLIPDDDTSPIGSDHTVFPNTLATGSATNTRTYTITNNGGAALTINGITVSGGHASNFTVSPLTYPLTILGGGGAQPFVVTFDPSAANLRSTTVLIDHSIATDDYDFKIAGQGTLGSLLAPEIEVTGNNLTILHGDIFPRPQDHTAFGQVLVNGGTVERTFTIHNVGFGPLNVTGVTVVSSSGDFTLTQAPTTPVAALGGSTTFKVTFNPSGTGPRLGTVFIHNNDSNEAPYKFAIGGTGKWNFTGGGFGWGGSLGHTAWIPLTDLGSGTTTLHPFGGTAVSLGGPRSVSWGGNTFGQLGNGTATARSTPVAVSTAGLLAGKTVVDLAAGQNHSVALCSDGTLVAWGQGTSGQLGHGALADSLVPVAVTLTGPLAGKTIVALSAGQAHTLALCSDGTVVAWGANPSGQLGNNSTATSAVPVLVPATGALAGKTVTSLAAGDLHSVALCSDGTVVTWGANTSGQLGNNSTTTSLVPVAVPLPGKTVLGIAAGAAHTLAACSDGTVAAWGRNHAGQLGDTTTTDRLTPVFVNTTGALAGKFVVALATGAAHTVAICADDTLVAWGDNSSGQLGDGTRANRTAPVLVNRAGPIGMFPVIALAAGAQHSVALTADSQLSAWGENSSGQLGTGDTANRLTPTPVALGVLAPGSHFSRLVAGASAHRTLALAAEPAPALLISGPTQDVFNAPGLSVPGDDTDFGRVVIATGTATRTFTLTNTGGAPLTFTGSPKAAINGANASEFTVTAQPASPVAPNGTTTLVVTFAPAATGPRLATLTLASDDPAQPTFTFSLTGTGTTSGTLADTVNSGANNVIFTTAVQPDGKNVLGGNFTRLGTPFINRAARFETDATLDLGFDPNVDGFVTAVLVQADGAIILGGQFTTVGGVTRNRLARVSADGVLDLTFNPDADNNISALALQPDGKLIVTGNFTTIGGIARGKIARLHADGTLDLAFNPNANRAVYTAAVQPDGKILLGGNFDNVGGVTRQRLARVLADGTLDPTFDPAPTSDVTSLLIQPDGKIVLAGQFGAVAGVTRNRVARLHADGSLDTTFDPNVDTAVYSLTAQADGKILLGGSFNNVAGVSRTRLARLHSDGTLDTTFVATADDDVVFSTALQADGKVVLAGYFASVNGTGRNFFARLDNDPAPQSLTVTSASRVQWLRGGASPETHHVTFELSTNGGATWTSLGAGTRLATGGGWEKTGLTLSGTGQIRARARTLGGAYSGSSGLVEAIATFGVAALPVITTQPLAQTVAVGGTATFTVVASGMPAPTYQWMKANVAGNNPIPGATNATLTLTNVQSSATASYSVVVTNSAGSVTSTGAMLTVSTAAVAPTITTQPVGQMVVAGGGATFSVAATGNPAPTYQWRKATVALSGATNATLVLSSVAVLDAGLYDVVVTNSAGSVPSTAVPLVVNVPPAIATQPVSLGAGAGTGVVFSVTATGTAPLSYQWSKDGSPLSGATLATLSLANVSAATAGVYRVTVTNVAGTTLSNPALLAVFDAFPTHAVAGPGYFAGGTVTITNTLTYSNATSGLGWQVLIPAGWSYVSGAGNEGNVKPAPGTTDLLEWAWTTVPGSPISFTYTLNVPAGTTGDHPLMALAIIRQGAGAGQILAKPDPLVVSRLTHHSADTTRDSALDLFELTRVIELYNTRIGTTRTGCYRVDATGEDGFAPDDTRPGSTLVTLSRYHTGDSNRDGRFSLLELTRVIELFNTRSGTNRTGQYHLAPDTEDGFAPGP